MVEIYSDKELLKKTFEGLHAAVFILNNDTPPKIIKCNSSAKKIFGYPKKEIVGKNTLFLHANKKSYDEFRKKVFSQIKRKKRVFLESVMKRKNGDIFPTKHSIVSLKNKKGERIGWVSIVRDITKKKEEEKALEESEEKYRTVTESSLNGLYVFQDGRIKFVNKAIEDMSGYTKKELFNLKDPFILIHPDFRDFMKETTVKVLMGHTKGIPREPEIKFIRKNGEEKWVHAKPRVIEYEGRKAIICSVLDITEKKKAEKEKERMRRKLRRYSKKLEKKVKKLEGDEVKLNKNEKLVLWGLVEFTEDNDKELAKKLGLKRPTVTAIRNRLKEKGLFFTIYMPEFKSLGAKLMAFCYGRLKKGQKDTRANVIVENNELFLYNFVFKDILDFEKEMSKKYLGDSTKIHFLFELSNIHKYFRYGDLLKHLFKIKIGKKEEKRETKEMKIGKNEKRVLLALLKNPNYSIKEMSKELRLSRVTISNKKRKLMENGLINKIRVPDVKKLDLKLMTLTHLKDKKNLTKQELKMLKESPQVVYSISNDKEALGVSFYKNYTEYKKEREKNKDFFSKEPQVFEILTKNLKKREFDHYKTVKNLLD